MEGRLVSLVLLANKCTLRIMKARFLAVADYITSMERENPEKTLVLDWAWRRYELKCFDIRVQRPKIVTVGVRVSLSFYVFSISVC